MKKQTLLIFLESSNQEYQEEFVKQLSAILTKLKHNSDSFPAASQ